MRKLAALVLLIAVFATLAISDSPPADVEFTFARVQFNMSFDAAFIREAPWHHDYPYSEDLFLTMLREVTSVNTDREAYQIVQLESPDIFKYPFLYVSEPGFMQLTPSETVNLREYLNRGGFVMFDDFRTWGESRDLANLRAQLKKVFPDRDLFRLDINHPVFHTFYDIRTLAMPPPYYEMVPDFWGMNDDEGRLQLVANHNNDFGEFWEAVDLGDRDFQPAAASVRFGINYLIYAMTH
jgi:hypothetical protein